MADARRAWANAFFEAVTALDSGSTRVLKLCALALRETGVALDKNIQIDKFFRNPARPNSDKVAMLCGFLQEIARRDGFEVELAQLEPLYKKFLELLARKRRIFLLPAIAKVFNRFVDEAQGITHLEVESVRELPQGQLDAIVAQWKSTTGAKEVVVTTQINTDLIGGVMVTGDSVRYDYTKRGRLNRLRAKLIQPI